MEVQKVLYMKGGNGETSFAKNSSLPREIIGAARSVMREALVDLYHAAGFPDKLTVADLGCSSGPNALIVVADAVDTVGEICRELGRSPPEFQLFLNDLPGNDFNPVFRSLKAFYEEREIRRCFVAGVPGSFYGQLFPSRSIHFFRSSSSLHWLSQVPQKLQQHGVPLNKGSIYISARSPLPVVHVYSTQFQEDFSNFLKCRSEEMIVGGRMVLTLIGRKDLDPTRHDDEAHFYWDILAQLLMDMAEEGYVEEEKVDSFNLPYYAPCAAELESLIRSEGSFYLKCLQMFEVPWEASQGGRRRIDGDDDIIGGDEPEQQYGFNLPADHEKMSRGQSMSNCLRAVVESMLETHFGIGGDILQHLFSRYSGVLEDRLSRELKPMLPNIIMSLVRKEA